MILGNENALCLYDNDTVKWQHDGKMYCLHIRQDDTPLDPRRDWDHPGTIMACWHRRYNFGDEIRDKIPEEFWQRLVRENVPDTEILEAAEAGKLVGIRIARNSKNGNLTDIYETVQWNTVIGNGEPSEELEYEGIPREAVAGYLMDDLTITHCMILMESYAEWLPLWMYDHGGITMSCGVRTGQYADQWDSGQAGWIVTTKVAAIQEIGYAEADWRDRSTELMQAEVEEYDQYLTGDVYCFTLYSATPVEEGEDPDWEEEDSCGGFFGSDILTNGIEDRVGNGLREALESGAYVEGEAKLHTYSYYEI